jgi:hypothetical protein
MIKYIVFFVTILPVSYCTNQSSQTKKSETSTASNNPDSNSSITKNSLIGTTVLCASEKNLNSGLIYGLNLDSIASTDCTNGYSEYVTPTKITGVRLVNDSTLIVTANITANCAYSFLGEIEIVSENTINLVYHGYGGYASCSCCFGLTYIISIIRNEDFKFDKLKYVTIDGIDKTKLPRLDK